MERPVPRPVSFREKLFRLRLSIGIDDPATHLELTMIHEVMVLDHSGPDFGFIEMGAFLEDVALTIHPHPTMSEAFQEAVEAALGRAVHIVNT